MVSPRRCSSFVRTSVLVGALSVGIVASFLAGCGGVTCGDDGCSAGGSGGGTGTGGAGGTTCTATKGTITGIVHHGSAPGMPDGDAVPDATLTFVVSPGGPGATMLQGKADGAGKFSVELDPATWLINGDDGTGCIGSQPVTVTLEACDTEQVDVVLDICSG